MSLFEDVEIQVDVTWRQARLHGHAFRGTVQGACFCGGGAGGPLAQQ